MEISQEWSFGDDEELADNLKQLVLSGKKRATTGLYRQEEKIPNIGEYAAILDKNKKRFCVVQYTNIAIKAFLDVDYEFILKEGEGDKDIETWREKHRKFFRLDSDNVKVVCEEFQVISRI